MLEKEEDNYDDSVNNSLAIMDIPLAIEDPMDTVWCRDSTQPNSVLHDILTHQFDGVEGVADLLEGSKEVGINDNLDNHILRDADVSPRVNKMIK